MEQLFAVVDIETGGFNKKKDAIVEIAVGIFNHQGMLIDEFSTLIKPYLLDGIPVNYGEKAMVVHGVTKEECEEEGMQFGEAMKSCRDLIVANKITEIVGHNLEDFDLPFISHQCSEFGLEPLHHGKKTFCTLKYVRRNRNYPNNRLGTVYQILFPEKYEIMKKNQHRASVDIIMTAEIYLNIKPVKKTTDEGKNDISDQPQGEGVRSEALPG